jgi:hypothetical protein
MNRVEVDLTLTRKTSMTDWMCEVPTGERVSKLMAVIGPNGGGKTALLKPIAFVGWFVAHSFSQLGPDALIPVTPHAAASTRPIEFECVVDFDGKLWRYVLHCTPHRVIHEALYQKKERFSYVFIRDWDEASASYAIKQQDFGLAAQEARKVRQNASLISTAAQYGVPLAQRMVAPYVVNNVNILGRVPMDSTLLLFAAEHFSQRSAQQAQMEQLLLKWDLGLTGVTLQQVPAPTQDDPNRKVWLPFGKHKDGDTEFSLPFHVESSGTQSAFVLLSRLLQALEIGGLAVIDEFENDLHPHMLAPILELFASPTTNPYNAQLLFTCHAVEVLNLIHKSQVILVQKDQNCESTACRLDAVAGVRNDDNLYAKYMAGAYGAVPEL